MHVYCHDEKITYTGDQLSSLWAYKNFGLQGDSIVCFRGPCSISFSSMVDLEDVLACSPIYGPDMLHFVVEHFERGLEKAVLRQRLLIAIIKDAIGRPDLERRGDDLYMGSKKLSISIATSTPVSVMIHAALNVITEGTPVETAGLMEMGYAEEDIMPLGMKICRLYDLEMSSVRMARCKVRGVG
ncbi:MAG: DUF366 family protein [Bacillota bacterium]